MRARLWKMIMKNKSALFAGIIAGMSSPASVYAKPAYPRLPGTDMERLRSDVCKIGGDFSTILEQENGKNKNADQLEHTP